jgi:(2Fe-2S) ferredoxin
MEKVQVPFQKILFVCVNQRETGEDCCSGKDSEAIAAAIKSRVKSLGLAGKVRVSKSGCQDLCAKGPNVMVFPDNVCYHGVALSDVDRIIRETLPGTTS